MLQIETKLKSSEKKSKHRIFEDFLDNIAIFENKEVLRPNYTPDNLPHRDKQIKSLASILVPAIRGDTPSNILIYGKTGTGKTAVVKFVGQELEDTSESHGIACHVLYINCEIVDTQYRLLATLAKHIGKEVPMTGWPTDQVFEEFKKTVDKEKRVVIIIMDEIDTEFLDPRVKSSLGEEEIIFPPYDAEQIHDILEQRAGLAFKKGMLDETVTRLCAAFAAQEHGDARRALDLLRVSGEIAERTKSPVVEEKHVRIAQEKIENDRVVEVVRTYTVYKHMCNDIGSDILTQRRITDLISELDMLGIINAMVVSKGRYGRTKEISLSVPMSDTKGVLMEDYRLKPLENYQPDMLVVQSRLM